jgi:nicotinate-nucleotide pyrophosphorylase (carboxylating)
MPEPLDPSVYLDVVRRALAEDIGVGDITTQSIIAPKTKASGVFLARRVCVLAGLDVTKAVLLEVDKSIEFEAFKKDGDLCEADDTIARVQGPAASLLTAERTALNFLQHLSGIATMTRRYVDAVNGPVTVLDTRKTVPNLRALAKYAVRCGGGANHRFGLFDGVLIKDNHVRLAGGVGEALKKVRKAGVKVPIEVEVESLEEVDQAIEGKADVIMLDNMDDAMVREAVARIQGCARVELSGGITIERMHTLASLGADCVSVGAITHSAPAADISFEIGD